MADINLSDITGMPVTTYQDLSAPAAGDMFWSMATSRNGCYIANGADYAIADEPDLYAAIGTAFNTQINPTTGSAWAAPAAGRFRVPDMRAVVPRGAGAVSTGGYIDVGSYYDDRFQGHRHSTVNGGGLVAGGTGTAANAGTGAGFVLTTVGDPISDGTNGTPRIGSETRVKSRGGNWFIRRFNATYVAIGTGVATADRPGLVSNAVKPTALVASDFTTQTNCYIEETDLPLNRNYWTLNNGVVTVYLWFDTFSIATLVPSFSWVFPQSIPRPKSSAGGLGIVFDNSGSIGAAAQVTMLSNGTFQVGKLGGGNFSGGSHTSYLRMQFSWPIN